MQNILNVKQAVNYHLSLILKVSGFISKSAPLSKFLLTFNQHSDEEIIDVNDE